MKNSGTLTQEQWNRFHTIEMEKEKYELMKLEAVILKNRSSFIEKNRVAKNVIKTEHKVKKNSYIIEY